VRVSLAHGHEAAYPVGTFVIELAGQEAPVRTLTA
jgi:hypothetical protein